MGNAEIDFWYPGKDGRPWIEQLPARRPLGLPLVSIELPPTDTTRPVIYDQFDRPIIPSSDQDSEATESD